MTPTPKPKPRHTSRAYALQEAVDLLAAVTQRARKVQRLHAPDRDSARVRQLLAKRGLNVVRGQGDRYRTRRAEPWPARGRIGPRSRIATALRRAAVGRRAHGPEPGF
jgi:hypothetical protein